MASCLQPEFVFHVTLKCRSIPSFVPVVSPHILLFPFAVLCVKGEHGSGISSVVGAISTPLLSLLIFNMLYLDSHCETIRLHRLSVGGGGGGGCTDFSALPHWIWHCIEQVVNCVQ